MLNFNKKKYVSFDNLSSFSGMIQKAMSDKLNNVESRLKQMIDSRFQSLTSKEQGDSEVIDAREGKLTLLENLRTFVKKNVYESERDDIRLKLDDVKSTSDLNKEYINTNKSAISRVIEFVDMFKCSFVIDGTEGVITLPLILSGVSIQWGYVVISDGNENTSVIFHRPFSSNQYNINITPYVVGSSYVCTKVYNANNNSINVSIKGVDNSNPGGGLYWFAIGR